MWSGLTRSAINTLWKDSDLIFMPCYSLVANQIKQRHSIMGSLNVAKTSLLPFRWIDIGHGVPTAGVPVLIAIGQFREYVVGSIEENNSWTSGANHECEVEIEDITHWAYIPTPSDD